MTPRHSGKPPRGWELWVALGAMCVWLIDLGLMRGGTPHPLDDTWEYGLVARSLLAGHGFRTAMIHPPLWGMHDAGLTVPVLVHGPLLPLLGAPLLAWFGPAALDRIAWLAAAFAILAAVFTARAVTRAAGLAAGAVAAALVTFSPIMLRMVHHDLAPAAGACATALALDLVARARPRAFWAGLVTGAGALVRPELLLAAPFAAWLLGAMRAVPFAIGCVLVVVPWALHTLVATGSPAFNLSSYLLIAYTRTHPGLSPLWDFGITPARWPSVFMASLPELPAKWLSFAPRAFKHLLMAPGPGLGLVSALGAVATCRTHATRRLGWAALGVAAIPFVLCTTTESSERYVAVFLPLWAAGAVRGADALGDALRARWVREAVFAALMPFWGMALAREASQSAALRRWLADERIALQSRGAAAEQRRLLFSDTPDFAAWTTGRPTIATTREAYLALRQTAPAGAPPAGRAQDEWFHADVRTLPAPARGGAATAHAALR